MSAPLCPACRVPLQAGRFGEADIEMCPQCMGALVPQRAMIALMTALTKELVGQIDFDHRIDPLPRQAGPVPCPRCASPMDSFGYMETNLVYAWRCGREWLNWIPADAMGVMAVLYARTQHRTQARQAERDEEQEGLNRRVTLMLKSRFRSEVIARGLT